MKRIRLEPIACSLSPEELRERRAELLPGLMQRAEGITAVENGVRLQFSYKRGILEEVARVLEQEHRCCRFLRFQLTIEPGEGPVFLEVTGPSGTRELLEGLAVA